MRQFLTPIPFQAITKKHHIGMEQESSVIELLYIPRPLCTVGIELVDDLSESGERKVVSPDHLEGAEY